MLIVFQFKFVLYIVQFSRDANMAWFCIFKKIFIVVNFYFKRIFIKFLKNLLYFFYIFRWILKCLIW